MAHNSFKSSEPLSDSATLNVENNTNVHVDVKFPEFYSILYMYDSLNIPEEFGITEKVRIIQMSG